MKVPFEVEPGEDEETNRRVHGRQPLQWLGPRLGQRGYGIEAVSVFLIAGLLLLQAACKVRSDKPLQRPGYVLSGSNAGAGFPDNALTVFDAATWQMHRQVSIPRSWAKNFSRDPQGRLWVGFSGNIKKSDHRLQIYSPQGELLKTLKLCGSGGRHQLCRWASLRSLR